MKLKLSEIVQATGGVLLSGDPETEITAFSTDSRTAKKGVMFVPIVGEKVDAHRFIPDVFASGASASFTQVDLTDTDQALVLVKDSALALQQTVSYYRSGFSLPIVGITGSAGKTTAKEMVALVLSAQLKVMKTDGNQNSQVGVPLTIARLRKEHEAAVVEMGISMTGEMARIAQVVKPNYAVITNIGVSHIEYLRTRENIMEEKLKIADHMPSDGMLFVNGDDDLLAQLNKQRRTMPIATFGLNTHNDYRAVNVRQVESGMFFTCTYRGGDTELFVPAMGAHNVRNALAAFAVAMTLGISRENAVRALAAYKPPEMRQRVIKAKDITIIDDSYNANPDSNKAALDLLSAYTTDGRKIAVLGDMFELGSHAAVSHHEVGVYAKGKNIEMLIGVGELASGYCAGFGDESRAMHFGNKSDALNWLRRNIKGGDVILVKGSRGMQMEELVSKLSAAGEDSEDATASKAL